MSDLILFELIETSIEHQSIGKFGVVLAILLLLLQTTPSMAEEKVTIAVVGGTTFGHPASFGKGLVEEEGSFTVKTHAGESPPIYRLRGACANLG